MFALRHLNIVPGDDEPEDFMADNTLALWASLHSELELDGLVEFPADQVPAEAFRHCFLLLADAIAPSHGRQPFAPVDEPLHPSRVFLARRMAVPNDGEVREIQEF